MPPLWAWSEEESDWKGICLAAETPNANLLNWRPATEIWRNKNMRNHVNSCVLVDGFLYGFDESKLKCLDWKAGAVKWSAKEYGKGALNNADGKLILFGQRGKLGVAQASPEGLKEISSFQALKGKDTWASPVLANGRIYARSIETLAV